MSFHQDGTVILYPMFAENRRLERRNDILDQLSGKGLSIAAVKDYSLFEAETDFGRNRKYDFDRENKIAYGAVSLRLDEEIFIKWCAEFGYKPVVFHSFQSVNGERLPIYHTNVMMCVGSDYAVICLDTIDDVTERELVEKHLQKVIKK